MPRSLRIQFEGAIYHVINRGNYKTWIFEQESTKAAFEKCLFEACEEFNWILHAYCIMGNHFHLALETPDANLSNGMRWLQSTFAMRYNRYRNENGHLFQGRFKGIIVEDADRLAALCHYIHLNPFRAGIVGLEALATYPHSSYGWLFKNRSKRPKRLDFELLLEATGGLKDGAAGRRKYAEYIGWLAEDDLRQKTLNFDKMSRGWAMGSKEFKSALIEDGKKETTRRILNGDADNESREMLWQKELDQCMKALEKDLEHATRDKKSAAWKVAICAHLRRTLGCRAIWIGKKLNMGEPAGISRALRKLKEGDSPQAETMLRTLKGKF